ncbi:hypothetical protein AgCh_031783 [Apium graveolens]
MNRTKLPIRKRLGDVPQFSRSTDAAIAEVGTTNRLGFQLLMYQIISVLIDLDSYSTKMEMKAVALKKKKQDSSPRRGRIKKKIYTIIFKHTLTVVPRRCQPVSTYTYAKKLMLLECKNEANWTMITSIDIWENIRVINLVHNGLKNKKVIQAPSFICPASLVPTPESIANNTVDA